MPRREDIRSILIPGSGPITIGQGCEFDYSGVQACKVLRRLGYRVILVNSNPATIMTDPDLADATYVEPLHPALVETIIAKERPDALLPTMGGQTALNLAMDLAGSGVLEKYGVELIGANARSIAMAEDREQFTAAMTRIGLDVPHGGFAGTVDEALEIVEDTGYPAIIRPSFTLGGTGGGIAYNRDEFEEIAKAGKIVRPSDGKPAKSVVFVQSPGKDASDGDFAYAGAVTSMVSLKQAKYVREDYEDGKSFIFYQHMRTPGFSELFYKGLQQLLLDLLPVS